MAERETNPKMIWTGRVLSALVSILLLMSAGMKLSHSPEVVQNFAKYGYAEGLLLPIALVELASVILFLVPQTAVFGGVLMAAYLGGATNVHVRAGEGFAAPVIAGVLAWAALYAREPRLRSLVPLRKV